MGKIARLASLSALMLLAACEVSRPWMEAQENKILVNENGYQFTVVPTEKIVYAVPEIRFTYNTLDMKESAIRAIEQATGCRVAASEFAAGMIILEARVECTSSHKQ